MGRGGLETKIPIRIDHCSLVDNVSTWCTCRIVGNLPSVGTVRRVPRRVAVCVLEPWAMGRRIYNQTHQSQPSSLFPSSHPQLPSPLDFPTTTYQYSIIFSVTREYTFPFHAFQQAQIPSSETAHLSAFIHTTKHTSTCISFHLSTALGCRHTQWPLSSSRRISFAVSYLPNLYSVCLFLFTPLPSFPFSRARIATARKQSSPSSLPWCVSTHHEDHSIVHHTTTILIVWGFLISHLSSLLLGMPDPRPSSTHPHTDVNNTTLDRDIFPKHQTFLRHHALALPWYFSLCHWDPK